jgi:hypothetical protein
MRERIVLQTAWLFCLFCLAGAPLAAQPQIGGGTCNSGSLNGTYDISLTGRQVAASGAFSNVFQANGSAVFDGLSKVTLTMSANTLQSLGSPLTYSGTYSAQANCAGTISLSSGDTATLNLIIYNQGKAFAVTGTDSTYAYTGGGNTQPTGCSTSMLTGVYAFNATGYTFSGGAVNGIADSTGLLQFDGQGNVTANLTSPSAAVGTIIATGTYSLSSSCVGTATITDSSGKSTGLIFSITAAKGADFDLLLAQASKFMLSGAGHAIYGQATASAEARSPAARRGGRA